MSPEILNPEFKPGTLNVKTFDSGQFGRVNDFISNPCIFCLGSFEFAVSQNGGSSNGVDGVTVVANRYWH